MSYKVSIISDFHLGIRKNSDVMLESQLRFFNKQFFPCLRKNNIKEIIVLGDVFDSRIALNTKIINEAYNLFNNDFQFNILIGNHDTYFNNSIETNSLVFLKKFNNVKVIDKIQPLYMFDKMLFVPWIIDNDKFIKDLQEYKDVKLCFGHFDVNGFSMGGKISDSLLMPEVFNQFKKVFSGHFHTPQTKMFGTTEFIYCGSPYQTDWGEVGQRKGFYVLDTDSLEYEFIENTESAKHIKVTYGESFSPSDITNNFIKVFVKESETENEKLFDEFIKTITDLNPASIATVIVKEDCELDNELEISEKGQNFLELISEYVDLQETIDNKKEIKEILEEIYTESIRE
jgi:DNA repair exonuclease SbcCD nuclease subunit